MNTSCPTCGAIYNVAAKDIGRKLKCKKCSTALMVTEAGLEIDAPVAPPTPSKSAPVVAAVENEELDDEPLVKKKKGRFERGPGSGVNPLVAIGGIPTILFGFGVFLVIVFTSLPIIGVAGTDRAKAYVDKLENEKTNKILALSKGKKGEPTADELTKIAEETKKINEDYSKKLLEAQQDAESTRISNRRDVWMERYGLMFGFILVSFGCIGYLRTEQPLVLKIVAGATLFFMLVVMFGTFGVAGCVGGNPLKG